MVSSCTTQGVAASSLASDKSPHATNSRDPKIVSPFKAPKLCAPTPRWEDCNFAWGLKREKAILQSVTASC